MVVPVIYSETGSWAYITTMVTNATKTGCKISIHNLEDADRTVKVGYIIVG